jgi:hypothetical protein
MKTMAVAMGVLLLAACAGVPVKFETGSGMARTADRSPGRMVSAEACGFQLLLFIPIGVNDRLQRAYGALQVQAGGAPLVDIEVDERWSYGFVGTRYCTTLKGRALVPAG